MTVAELLAAHGQDADLTFKLWEPLCIAALNTPMHKASAQVCECTARLTEPYPCRQRHAAAARRLHRVVPATRGRPCREDTAARYLRACGVEAIVSAKRPHRTGHLRRESDPSAMSSVLRRLTSPKSCCAPVAALDKDRRTNRQTATSADLHRIPAISGHAYLPHAMIGLHRGFSQWLFDKGRIAGQSGLLAAVISAEGIHRN